MGFLVFSSSNCKMEGLKSQKLHNCLPTPSETFPSDFFHGCGVESQSPLWNLPNTGQRGKETRMQSFEHKGVASTTPARHQTICSHLHVRISPERQFFSRTFRVSKSGIGWKTSKSSWWVYVNKLQLCCDRKKSNPDLYPGIISKTFSQNYSRNSGEVERTWALDGPLEIAHTLDYPISCVFGVIQPPSCFCFLFNATKDQQRLCCMSASNLLSDKREQKAAWRKTLLCVIEILK